MPSATGSREMSRRETGTNLSAWPYVAGAVAIVLLLMWPLETILVAIMAASAYVLLEAIDALLATRVSTGQHVRTMERARIAAGVALVLGIVLVALSPLTMTIVSLCAALLACGINLYSHQVTRGAAIGQRRERTTPRPRPVQTRPPMSAPAPTAGYRRSAMPRSAPRAGSTRPKARRAPMRPAPNRGARTRRSVSSGLPMEPPTR